MVLHIILFQIHDLQTNHIFYIFEQSFEVKIVCYCKIVSNWDKPEKKVSLILLLFFIFLQSYEMFRYYNCKCPKVKLNMVYIVKYGVHENIIIIGDPSETYWRPIGDQHD